MRAREFFNGPVDCTDVFAVIVDLGYDLVRLGIIVIVAMEISLITPPVGPSHFVLRSAGHRKFYFIAIEIHACAA